MARVIPRSDDAYEAARRATVWNGRVPDRYPDVVIQAENEDDVVTAVRYAAARELEIGICSGGHSWAANHLREGGVLLDVSRLDSVAIDAESRTATVGPGRKGDELCGLLESDGLFFPAGHCQGVAVGGYLLQGGYGWHGRLLGPACESVLGIDVVTADGECVHADSVSNADLFWAARGAGPGFFGVVTKFYLQLYAQPAVSAMSTYIYPITELDEIFTWARRISAEVDRRVEMQLMLTGDFAALGVDEPAIGVISPVFADSEEGARAALALIDSCPTRSRALVTLPFTSMPLRTSYKMVMHSYPDGYRYATDNMWTSAPVEELLPGLHAIAESLPPPPSHVLWLNWGPSPERADMAYSVEDEIYLALYGVWKEEADDVLYQSWPATHMRAMSPLASGIQLADENLGERPARFMTDANMARLDGIRASYDPTGRFHSWMVRP